MENELPALTDADRARYEWQMWCPGIGGEGQRKLKDASVLISRCGGVGGVVAYQLAAAGVGKLVIVHAGNIKPSDLNRQLLMTDAGIGHSRAESIERRLREFNPHIEIEVVPENIGDENAYELVSKAGIVASCAPLFPERFAMNDACVRQGKPMVDAAMYDFEIQMSVYWVGRGPCMRCVYPEAPPYWKRQFPVLGAVSSTVASLAAAEVVKIITGCGEPSIGRLVTGDLRTMEFRKLRVRKSGATCCSS
ncbi:MAG: MoeZ/MoeB [Verrucomicrobiales bacterium]|nr:MoeZ/MoeB [Verrucomicrobiales bacterium]|tara:strand:- start:1654 stop:2403 length:750 start_codon:yes stop_codon:yes gene_type:complete